jgi:hypothetical protein
MKMHFLESIAQGHCNICICHCTLPTGIREFCRTPRNECQETKRQPNAMPVTTPGLTYHHLCASHYRIHSTRSRAPVARQQLVVPCAYRNLPCQSGQSAAATGSRRPRSRGRPGTASGCAATIRKSTVSELAHEKHASQSTARRDAQDESSSMMSSSLMSSS